MNGPYFVAIDFDGTVTDVDIIDAVLQSFARPEWQEAETLWEQGIIGSRECLERQMSMVDQPLGKLLDYIDGFSIDGTFKDFAGYLDARDIPYAVISDGFQVFIERLLANAGLGQVPVYANLLREERGTLRTVFPYSQPDCDSANCKCTAVSELSKERSLIVIGDGQSDFCLAHQARHVFTKKKLSGYCRENNIPYTAFVSFAEIAAFLETKRTLPAPLQRVEAGKDRSWK
jgi:2-hydroxy-3-keto-5-methylthiopentenyl-1-phosphate phosphatase